MSPEPEPDPPAHVLDLLLDSDPDEAKGVHATRVAVLFVSVLLNCALIRLTCCRATSVPLQILHCLNQCLKQLRFSNVLRGLRMTHLSTAMRFPTICVELCHIVSLPELALAQVAVSFSPDGSEQHY